MSMNFQLMVCVLSYYVWSENGTGHSQPYYVKKYRGFWLIIRNWSITSVYHILKFKIHEYKLRCRLIVQKGKSRLFILKFSWYQKTLNT